MNIDDAARVGFEKRGFNHAHVAEHTLYPEVIEGLAAAFPDQGDVWAKGWG